MCHSSRAIRVKINDSTDSKSMNARSLLIIIALGLAVAGCSRGSMQESPIGIGSSPNDLKKSPCACIVLPNGADHDGRIVS